MNTSIRIGLLVLLAIPWVLAPSTTRAQEDGPRAFDAPDAAAAALVQAARAHDVDALVALVGGRHAHLFLTGDGEADRQARVRFADAASERVRLEKREDGRVTVLVGYADWAFPVPLVQREGGWVFDGAEGAREVRDRRIGANEIAAITFCEAVYAAQLLYRESDHDQDGVLEYAQRLVSTPGRRDGLWWDTKAGEPASPLGRVLGLVGERPFGAGPGAAWMGYTFRLLASQGRCAPGGPHAYVIHGNMVAGFAVLAVPRTYGDTGIATFAMGPNGVVLQRDYGQGTAACTCRLGTFSPDASWSPVD